MELNGPGKYVKSIYKALRVNPDINNVKLAYTSNQTYK